METRDFIYHFTNILFSEIVKDIILNEGWAEADFDYRYAEYIKIFHRMKESHSLNTDDVILKSLNISKYAVINSFNNNIKKKFLKYLNSCGISQPVAEELLPDNIFNLDTINPDILNAFRNIEENILKEVK
ncbi:MAG: hypothetical protein LBT84_03950 [Spirochaetia bacterium]|jgi:hypothetical protein|nr:hypothetical protein [Spirochaetia bacterium]